MPPNIKIALGSKFIKNPSRYTVWKILELIIIGLLMASIMWTINFLYQYAYITLDNAEAIVILNAVSGTDTVDSRSFDAVQKAVNLKKELSNIDPKIRNILYYGNENTTGTKKSLKK